jgi:hypothetical protein
MQTEPNQTKMSHSVWPDHVANLSSMRRRKARNQIGTMNAVVIDRQSIPKRARRYLLSLGNVDVPCDCTFILT